MNLPILQSEVKTMSSDKLDPIDSEHCCPESDKNYEAEQAKREREFQEKVFADCDKWDNRELGADEAYAKKADMRFGVMIGFIPNQEMRTKELKTFVESVFKAQTKLSEIMKRSRAAVYQAMERGVSEKFYEDFIQAKQVLLELENDNLTAFETAFYARNLANENEEAKSYALDRLIKYGKSHKSANEVTA